MMVPVFVFFAPHLPEEHGIFEGARSYAADLSLGWEVVGQPVRRGHGEIAFLAIPAGSVVIGRMPEWLQGRILAKGVHWVEWVPEGQPVEGHAAVAWDPCSIGRAAARHLLAAGARTFVVQEPGDTRITSRIARNRAFLDAVTELGGRGLVLEPIRGQGRQVFLEQLKELCACQPPPIAFFLYHDRAAESLVDDLMEAGLKVPEDVLVVGGSGSAAAATARVPLSTVRLPYTALGRAAATQAHRLLSGDRPEPIAVRAFGVIERDSSAVRGSPRDPLVSRALRLATRRDRSIPSVAALARHLDVTRQTLLKHFRRELGRSPKDWLTMQAMQRAADLLAGTDLHLADVARSCGFAHRTNFAASFKKYFGITPRDYRAQVGKR